MSPMEFGFTRLFPIVLIVLTLHWPCGAMHIPSSTDYGNITAHESSLFSRDNSMELYHHGKVFYYDGFAANSHEVQQLEGVYEKLLEYVRLVDVIDASDPVFERWFSGHSVSMVQTVFDLMQDALTPRTEGEDPPESKIWITKIDWWNKCTAQEGEAAPLAYTSSVQAYDGGHENEMTNRDKMSPSDTLIALCTSEVASTMSHELTECSQIEGFKTVYYFYMDFRVGMILHELVHSEHIGDLAKHLSLPHIEGRPYGSGEEIYEDYKCTSMAKECSGKCNIEDCEQIPELNPETYALYAKNRYWNKKCSITLGPPTPPRPGKKKPPIAE